ncbi:IS1634 family transposase [Desulfosporosinus youngiae]|uniref:Transposase n=1 Tax=Desulfosporosinus youngiae DSM 17734 TaxID=768710 RepID=H5XYX8_9FIRM|nr:IS1634 family transposase [Desulfosporosinus youngiae]EHQ89159.1 transposase [Desulfosporosinus youngiae DSM 17734]EHQ91278.1 transposase [Desulfosporosinus youngiae DSM 17734]EHQ91451.1 transposase [Desulfosporosinus youngiae DSM 17734]EHQ91684.1 transposase [Desulfosporosinus youngiae DSM 17734]
MFVKVTPRTKGGKTYYFAELVEAYREGGKVKHKRILYFGSVDLEIAEKLKIVFSKDFDSFTNINKVDFLSAVPYGSFFLIHSIFERLKMFPLFKKHFVSKDKHITIDTALTCLMTMIFQRIIQPDSKLALTEWLDATPVRHFLLDGEKVPDLQTIYRSLEVLNDNYPVVEQCLYDFAKLVFHQNMQELYYDITSSYFEGHQCIISDYGYSRDHRGDREQLVIGLVTTPDGFPIKCNIYSGNTSDKTTVPRIVEELKNTYQIKEFIFVGDRGMLSDKNIKAIIGLEQKYVMAIPRAWSKKYLIDIAIDETQMQEIQDNLFVRFLPPIDGQRFLLCLNTQKRTDDTEYRNHCIEAIKEGLNTLNKTLIEDKKSRIKTRDEAMKKVGAILKQNKTGKYFDVQGKEDTNSPLGFVLEYSLKSDKVESDQRLDGTFVIQTNEQGYEGEKLVKIYKNLNKVETAFRIIKNDLDIRPMYHRKEARVKGHIYVCVLAYFTIIALETIAHRKNVKKSARKILSELNKIGLIEILLPTGEKRYSLTTIGKDQRRLLNTYDIKKIGLPDVV